jgi:hypothetical protein
MILVANSSGSASGKGSEQALERGRENAGFGLTCNPAQQAADVDRRSCHEMGQMCFGLADVAGSTD